MNLSSSGRSQLCSVLIGCLSVPSMSFPQVCGKPPDDAKNHVPFPMYLNSRPQDASSCSLTVNEGVLQASKPVSNPAMTCPDMFAWKLFAEAVRQEFWTDWAADAQTWPKSPLPMCGAGGARSDCCTPGQKSNPGYDDAENPAISCPYYPGDHRASSMSVLRIGSLPSKAHQLQFAALVSGQDKFFAVEPGRKIRQSMAEIVFRNRPMFYYVFDNDLYHQEGLGNAFRLNASNLANGAPYRVASSRNQLAEIDFPVDSVMIKSNWLSKDRAVSLGLKDDPKAPYIKMTIKSRVTDNNGSILLPGEHWLVALHISSKDIPQWEWATFEHVNNPGRCDYTGCNDSYGYTSADTVGPKQAKNFTSPYVKCDQLDLASWVFDPNRSYPTGAINPALADVFMSMGIGTKPSAGPVPSPDGPVLVPSSSDVGWLSYRLKGSQTGFTDSIGHATHLGNSITEGGFVNTSSCITCHARAGTTAEGSLPPALSVFANELDITGYFQSARGIPDEYWFMRSRTPIELEVLQTDFVWGFLAANPLQSVRTKSLTNVINKSKLPQSVRERTKAH